MRRSVQNYLSEVAAEWPMTENTQDKKPGKLTPLLLLGLKCVLQVLVFLCIFNNWIQFLGWTGLGEDLLLIEPVSAAQQSCSDCSSGQLHFLFKAVEAVGGGWWMWAVYSKADITSLTSDLTSWASSSINSQSRGPSERGSGIKFQFHHFEFLSGVLISLHWLCRELRHWGLLC